MGQPLSPALKEEEKFLVIQPKQLQDRRVQVINLDPICVSTLDVPRFEGTTDGLTG